MGFSIFHRPLDDGKNFEISDSEVDDYGSGCDDLQLPDEGEKEEADGGGGDEKDKNEFVFGFRFQTYEEFSKLNKEKTSCERLDSLMSNRYEFMAENSTSHFVEEAQIQSLTEVIGDEEISEKERKLEEGSDFDMELNGLETEWEHQELIEQLKMELKKVRATGLPTIFEESESPMIIMGELKPWKIDERFKYTDLMEDLHKSYTTYTQRMRKLDILNYQKMYVMGILQSKDPLIKSSSSKKKSPSPSPSPSITSLLRLFKEKKCEVDPIKDFIREVECELEMVYVGQMCLSWEFIQWQYEKALDLWESEPHGLHHYNEVAADFQHFQVLLQRFMENEVFDGPRVENYAKHRCASRNLLQVPVIREDKMKYERKETRWRDDENEAITNDMLVEILQESIRVIWKFIRADKDHGKKFQVELQNPVDMQLLTEIHADLQKKERKLKEIVRSGHCIYLKSGKRKKKMKKQKEL